MNKKAEFKIQNMLISMLIVGLFMGVFSAIVIVNSSYYETTGFDESEFEKINKNQNLTQIVQEQYELVDGVTVEESWFDFFSGIWSKLLAPFRAISNTFKTLISIANTATSVFQLLPVFKEFFSAAILVLVVIGIVLIKFGLGRSK